MDLTRLAEDLKIAVNQFQDCPSPESLVAIVAALRAFGLSGQRIFGELIFYTKQHPVRVAFTLGLVFYALKGIAESARPRQIGPELH
jgi:hypothetical protein